MIHAPDPIRHYTDRIGSDRGGRALRGVGVHTCINTYCGPGVGHTVLVSAATGPTQPVGSDIGSVERVLSRWDESLETPRADEMGRRSDILRTSHEP